MQPTDRIALVTGGNRGIGLEVVRQLAARGFTVFMGSRRTDAGAAALRSLEEVRSRVRVLPLTVTETASLEQAAKTIQMEYKRLDVLINNAGILLDQDKPLEKLDRETFMKTLVTNTWAPLKVIQTFLPLLRKSKDARIINVSSGAGSITEMSTYAPAYSISKAALNAVTRQMASALKADHITVNSVCPGWVRTDMGGSAAPRSVEEGADTIVWLAAEAPSTLTNQFLRDRKPAAW